MLDGHERLQMLDIRVSLLQRLPPVLGWIVQRYEWNLYIYCRIDDGGLVCLSTSTLDIIAAFDELRMAKGEEWKTAFRTGYGFYESLVMNFGLCGVVFLLHINN